MNLVPNLKVQGDDELAFLMGNWYPKSNGSYPSLDTHTFCCNTFFILLIKKNLFQMLNA